MSFSANERRAILTLAMESGLLANEPAENAESLRVRPKNAAALAVVFVGFDLFAGGACISKGGTEPGTPIQVATSMDQNMKRQTLMLMYGSRASQTKPTKSALAASCEVCIVRMTKRRAYR